MMRYVDAIQYLYQTNLHRGVKLGLDEIRALAKRLGHPETKFPSVHVAGTNGKGSVTTKIAKGFEYSGKKTGLFTSPHISSFRERIQINGELIPEHKVTELLEKILSQQSELQPTFFEITTLMALLYFAEEHVDIAILETGLGGRLDATNIVTPLLSIITSIALEHTEILGSTLEAITLEKAGIIKPNTPLVIGPRVLQELIEPLAKNLNSPLEQVFGTFSNYDEENSAIAKRALQRLNIPPHSIERALKVRPPCRMQSINSPILKSPVILDVAHNPDGLTALFPAVRQHHPEQNIIVIAGLSKSKDLSGCLTIISAHATEVYLVEASNGRGAKTEELCAILEKLRIDEKKYHPSKTVTKAFSELSSVSCANSLVIVCGSFFIMDEAFKCLQFDRSRDPVDLNECFNTNINSFIVPKKEPL